MSQSYVEDQLRFEFPDDWIICRPQDCSFYSEHFQRLAGGCKETDFLAYDPRNRVLWLIEVKDYAWFRRAKTLALEEEMALKVRDSLALLPAAIRDSSVSDAGAVKVGDFWRRSRRFESIGVVLHCEVPRKPSKLFPGVRDVGNLQQKLRQAVRCVDPHARVTSIAEPDHVPWNVERI